MQASRSAGNNGGGGQGRNLQETILAPLVKTGGSPNKSYAIFSFLILLLLGAFFSSRLLLDPSVLVEREAVSTTKATAAPADASSRKDPRENTVITEKPPEFPLTCTSLSDNSTCPRDNYPTATLAGDSPSAACPEYFRWIHEDLRPWARTGITRDAVERAKKTANFRLVIVGGRVYVEKFNEAFQTRDVFTIWGFLQLVRRYPGKIPDLELMFDCVDWPVIKAAEFAGAEPPPLFRYCGNDETLDIVFPDWSFWGWAEVNIKPWEGVLRELGDANRKTKWLEREPYAYWKGNPTVAETRQDLMKCNVSEEHDWNARLYSQDWARESKEGYKQSDLASQCVHRYKIYIEGSAWSVSEKYILACDSVTLLVKPRYYDFFTRGLLPAQHFWPIKDDDKCRSIKFAVDWANSHARKAEEMGKKGSEFIMQQLKMEYVYDYMYHLLTEYSKLLRFKPEVPRQAGEGCSESMACPRDGNERKFMRESLVKRPSETGPCLMPPPYDPASFYSLIKKKDTTFARIHAWERRYWLMHKKNQTGN
ncbi:PREDICTED: O-glucosyltransferase rumi homolog isoform X1 [Tarenaya hassleriana]|uniref:O-glucosyltransferase rumi homolog isoform X1 n=1 Tax=Tarenaya hassleriana TaxID=28532 RepID=UPI00053C783F|nr:PREDICTED: O-glucosyltransferase rumi homolog isoform X1 [Tarenaya hassleriana]